ncbi:AAA family ATPase [Candidatus Lucifugimonas marina]|uniref:AAA family ATPase n=1 Tax=Candidatus Lucifugimonas marina TaxID=3038979 RepID=A0AAJ5ZIS2_9CHLR|nr:AAA family ATPase [SAR202 cluster bacterium JH702]MDG0870227.1 AAA family ATPase [SAR202 cluster bacterium JH639]WFG36209.1 AAA family ATPase [SAR202 cluster bacterium JH545]WFG40155.1 AAA family ATPase [SAR202 cluster bacterium JH1073]
MVDPNAQVVDDLEAFIDIFPYEIAENLRAREDIGDLVEVVLDLGRNPEARFSVENVSLAEIEVTRQQIAHVVEHVGHFGDDNRAGIERTLHRISVMRNRAGEPVGLTCRVGRAVYGSVRLIEDLIRSGKSVLILGRPGVGKTTILRETARVLADEAGKRVVVVDTSNEIAGDGDVPHPAIGRARRMQVANTSLQHKVMIEGVENHMPEVIVIDEMSTELEALAARTIAERGVQLVATAHGNTLGNVMSNPTLADLVGGQQTVTLGDIEARRRRTQKTVLERKHDPTFDIVVEIRERNAVAIHPEVGTAIDRMLRGISIPQEARRLQSDGRVETEVEEIPGSESEFAPAPFDVNDVGRRRRPRDRERGRGRDRQDREPRNPFNNALSSIGGSSDFNLDGIDEPAEPPKQVVTKVFPFGIPKTAISEVVNEINAPVQVVDFADSAEIFVTTKSHYSRRPTAVRRAERDGVIVHVLRRGTKEQIRQFLKRFGQEKTRAASVDTSDFEEHNQSGRSREALKETEAAISRIVSGEQRVELMAQPPYVRRLQHGLAARNNLGSASMGREPSRRVVIRRRKR